MAPKKFTFHYIPKKFERQMLKALGGFGIMMVLIFCIPFVLEVGNLRAYIPYLIIVPFVAFFGMAFYYYRTAGKKYIEEILLFDESFQSKQFGETRYDDIKSVNFIDPLRGATYLDVRLKEGNKLRFAANIMYSKDELVLKSFAKALAGAALEHTEIEVYGFRVNDSV